MVYEVCGSEQKKLAGKPCPECGQAGKKVPGITVASLLNTEEQEKLKATDYNLCLGPRLICYCKNVTDTEILDHIVNRQCCHNLKDIQELRGPTPATNA